jgi:hypothetical protein
VKVGPLVIVKARDSVEAINPAPSNAISSHQRYGHATDDRGEPQQFDERKVRAYSGLDMTLVRISSTSGFRMLVMLTSG